MPEETAYNEGVPTGASTGNPTGAPTGGTASAPVSTGNPTSTPTRSQGVLDDATLKQMIRDNRPSFYEQYGYCLVTFILIGICVAVYIVEVVFSGFSTDISSQTLYTMGAMFAPAIQSPLDAWRFVTPMFLHCDLMHLLFNMAALYSVGVMLEQMLGKANYLLLYFIAGISGNVLSYAVDMATASYVVSAGASTSIFGLFVATALLGLLSKYDRAILLEYSKGMLAVIGLNIVYTLAIPNVSMSGHLGGALGGIVAMFMVPAQNLRVPAPVRIIVALVWLAAVAHVLFNQGFGFGITL